MTADSHQTTKVPLSCGEAWIAYFRDEELVNGSPRGNVIDDMQAAFDAGWAAALAAIASPA
jgi:hypothetical protein